MARLLWPLALVVAFVAGWAVSDVARREPALVQEVDRLQKTVSRLLVQVDTLQARLRAREQLAASQRSGTAARAPVPPATASAAVVPPANTPVAARVTDERVLAGTVVPEEAASRAQRAPGAPHASSRPVPGSAHSAPERPAAPPPTVEAALDRFYRYLEAIDGAQGREQWQRARRLADELRGMGEVAAQALMQVLATGGDSDERRTAARMLGTLQNPQALPVLKDVIEQEQDVLLRRAAAAALRRLPTPDAVPVMERLVTDPAEDRFVRLSASIGLARSDRPLGVAGLTHIFEESNADGRGREIAFRALASLRDERALPFMRQLVTSQAEPSYRLQAIRYLTSQGDRQALGALHVVMDSPQEQPSIRDAAAHAFTAISSR
jgi:hypothetical protein